MKITFLTLLFLALASLACTIQIPDNSLGTAITTPTNALGSTEKPIPAPSALGKPELGTATVTASQSLNVRERAGWQQIRVLGVLSHGDTVTLTGKCDHGWAEIVWDAPRGTAWVNSKYLSENICSEEQ